MVRSLPAWYSTRFNPVGGKLSAQGPSLIHAELPGVFFFWRPPSGIVLLRLSGCISLAFTTTLSGQLVWLSLISSTMLHQAKGLLCCVYSMIRQVCVFVYVCMCSLEEVWAISVSPTHILSTAGYLETAYGVFI